MCPFTHVWVSPGYIHRNKISESKIRGNFNLNKLTNSSSKYWLFTPSPMLGTVRPFTYCRSCQCKKTPCCGFNCISLTICVAECLFLYLRVNCPLLYTVRSCLLPIFCWCWVVFFFLLVYIICFHIIWNSFTPICNLSFHISLENSGFEGNN